MTHNVLELHKHTSCHQLYEKQMPKTQELFLQKTKKTAQPENLGYLNSHSTAAT